MSTVTKPIILDETGARIAEAIEGLTTIQDGSITVPKFSSSTKEWIRGKRVYNVIDYGAKGDGETDDAPAIRSAIADLPASNWILYFPPGTYLQGDGSSECYFDFTGKSNFLVSGYGAKIVANPLNNPNEVADGVTGAGGVKYRGFKFIQCENGRIEGLYYDGNILARKPTYSDVSAANDQCAFKLRDCEYVFFVDCVAYGSVMDGFNMGGTGTTYDTYSNHCGMIRCESYYSYRQGLTVGNGHYGILDGCTFAYTGTAEDQNNTVYGTAPKAGIDFENGYPGYTDRGARGWSINNCTFIENGGTELYLSYGAYECVVDHCRFIRGEYDLTHQGISISQDSEYLTRNNTVKNCYFENCGIDSAGNGLLFENNIMLNGYPIIKLGNQLYENGIARKNIINNNIIEYKFDISQESYTASGYVDNDYRRAYASTCNALDYTNNTIINACGGVVCLGTVDNMVGNVFKSNVTPADEKKLGAIATSSAEFVFAEKNRVDSSYYNIGSSRKKLHDKSISYEEKIIWSGSNQYAVAKFKNVDAVFDVLVYGKDFAYLLTGTVTTGSFIIERLYGNGNFCSISKAFSSGGYYYVCIKNTLSSTRMASIKIITRYDSDLDPKIELSYYTENPTSIANFVLKCPWTRGAAVTALPTGFDFVDGDYALFDTKPIWYKSGHWYYADGTEATNPA